ncbi:MAG: alpha-hydroxy-acid oxidizing protein [Candidatus Methanomethylophilaceae archaeon]|nr:alpha-hydroxy-acid oxidizing protein [Candidatus Methanomethylophilaceae archaeon]
MSTYHCGICFHKFDEDKEGKRFSDVPESWRCPLCMAPKSAFVADGPVSRKVEGITTEEEPKELDLSYQSDLVIEDGGKMDYIHELALSGKSPGEAMETLMPVKAFDDILVLGAQLARFPKDDSFKADMTTVIGKGARIPMVLETPIYVSHMSFGALSKEAKVALAKGSAKAGAAMCSGEGGVLPEEMEASHCYIFEYIPNRYSCTDEVFEGCDAVEIKVGQGTKPGMGGHLPGAKVTPEIAKIRGKPEGQDILSPSRYPDINSPEDMRKLVDELRERSGGKPIGIKIAAGNIEGDLEFISKTGCDFITIDGRGGATGSSPGFLKANTTVPTVYALARARRYMDEHQMTQDLVITGGFRTSGDVIKALAMGADAVAMASAPLMALGCQRYRICESGKCPMGIATHDPFLTKRLDVDVGAQRVANFMTALTKELATFVRITGHVSVHDLTKDDLCTTDENISKYCGIRHA